MKTDRGIVQEHAVSPVVGVMLMLVVTIIIAAVVSAFAGGLGSGTKTTPQASIDVKISNTSGTSGGPSIQFTLMSGDAIPTKDLAIITYYTNSTGGIFKHQQTASSGPTDLYNIMNYTQYCEWGYTDYCGIGNEVHAYGRVPILSDMRYGYPGTYRTGDGNPVPGSVGRQNLYSDFGNFTWETGKMMTASGTTQFADLLGINDDSSPHNILPVADFGPGSVVDVKILHIPSGKYIYNKEVVVS